MQFQVPQNIAMEDRIVGPLTMIQFVIVVVGGGIAFFFINLTGAPAWFSKGIGGFLAFATVVFAIGKFNDQPLYRFFKFIIAYVITPKTRVWHKGGGEVNLIRPSQHRVNAVQRTYKHVSKADVARLAVVLDSRGREGVLPPQQPAETQKEPKA
jgi:hypothetical protein